MNLLPSVAAVYEQMERGKGEGPLLTNFYPTADKLQRWIDERALYSTTAANVLFILRRDRDFFHVSYVATQATDLAIAVRKLVAQTNETLTVDVIGKAAQVGALEEPFVGAGFGRHTSLHRMTRTSAGKAEAFPAGADPEVVIADAKDGGVLAGMLEAELDRFAEQIPDADEMSNAAAQRKILIIRAGAGIAGLLFYEVTGVSSLLRHWVVNPEHRDRRVGARLMRRYFADCKDVRRFVLWVISNNDNAIERYRHYGYERDGLVDQVLMRRAS